jgi:thiosulfate dehydrogenase
LRFAGNDLACTSCHMNSGLKAYAAPFVSTFATFPMMVNDQVLTLAQRTKGCMTRSRNDRAMPEAGREMEAAQLAVGYLYRSGMAHPPRVSPSD